MNILFWVPPWPVNGDPNFFRNTVRKHLVPQANTASAFAKEIDFVIPEYFSNEADKLNHNIRTIKLPIDFSANLGNLNSQSYTEFYKRSAPDFEQEVADKLSEYLSDNYDIILLWETPVPFLEKMFPHAVIIHQMPGVFSRPPYPHTVTFDPIGLYRGGALQKYSHEFQKLAVANTAEELDALENILAESTCVGLYSLVPVSGKEGPQLFLVNAVSGATHYYRPSHEGRDGKKVSFPAFLPVTDELMFPNARPLVVTPDDGAQF